MRALALVVLVACGAHAAEPRAADAPTILEKGDKAPARGLWKPEALAVRDEAEHVGCDAERLELRKSAGVAVWVPIVVGVLAFGLGVSVGATLAAEGAKPK